jgi:uncharacterized protein (DUF736 family)
VLLEPASLVSVSWSWAALQGNLEWLIKPEGRHEPRSPSATATPTFFPCRREAAFLAETKKQAYAVLCCATGLTAAGRSLPGQGSPSRPRWARLEQQTETIMATIGTFTASDNGYTGMIKTVTLSIKAKFEASAKDNDKSPDFRIFAGATEFGAAWKKTARGSDREFLSVKLDDPSFPAPIFASLIKVEGDDGFTLIWSRRNAD